jgi:hypothetical protein
MTFHKLTGPKRCATIQVIFDISIIQIPGERENNQYSASDQTDEE